MLHLVLVFGFLVGFCPVLLMMINNKYVLFAIVYILFDYFGDSAAAFYSVELRICLLIYLVG